MKLIKIKYNMNWFKKQQKKIRMFIRKLSLQFIYWSYWKLGNRSVYDAYDLLATGKDVEDTYLKTKTTWIVTKFNTKKIREVAEYNLKAILIKLIERSKGEWIGPSRSDIPFLRDKVEEIVGRFTFFEESVILYDGIEIQCTIKGAEPDITRLFLMIQLLYGDYENQSQYSYN